MNWIIIMNRGLLLAVLSLFLEFSAVTPTLGGSILYEIQNYADLQNGYTISGTITTDGTLGTLVTADITAWSYTITGAGGGYTVTSQDAGSSIALARGLTANATSITLAPPPGPPAAEVGLTLVNSITKQNIGWDRINHAEDLYNCAANNATTWRNYAYYPSQLSLGGTTWVIASVPEPGSLSQALLVMACLAGAQMTRRYVRAASRSIRAKHT